MPSVNPITEISSGTFKLFCAAFLMAVTANNSLTANIESQFCDLMRFSILIAQLSMSSILMIKTTAINV